MGTRFLSCFPIGFFARVRPTQKCQPFDRAAEGRVRPWPVEELDQVLENSLRKSFPCAGVILRACLSSTLVLSPGSATRSCSTHERSLTLSCPFIATRQRRVRHAPTNELVLTTTQRRHATPAFKTVANVFASGEAYTLPALPLNTCHGSFSLCVR
ncbi:unnamed protein product, partial [Scytosiphon promiscuus]